MENIIVLPGNNGIIPPPELLCNGLKQMQVGSGLSVIAQEE